MNEKKRRENVELVLRELEEGRLVWKEEMGDYITINDIKSYLKDNIYDGCKCPACSLNVEVSPLVLTRSLVRPMAILFDIAGSTFKFVHKDEVYDRYGKHPNSLGKLHYWGFIVKGEKPEAPDGNPNDGMYAVTTKGYDFLMGRISAIKYKFTFNKKNIKPPSNFNKQKDVFYGDIMNERFEYNKHVKLN